VLVKNSNIKLIGRYLSGNCTTLEKQRVQNWMNNSAENRLIFENYKKIWDSTAPEHSLEVIDVDKAWENINDHIVFAEKLAPVFAGNGNRFTIKPFTSVALRIAAVIVVAFGIYFLLKRPAVTVTKQFIATEVQKKPLILPDGSQVFLNKDAKITWPETFAFNERNLQLEGEAFFNVTHNPNKPFIVSAGDVRVKVFGTTFDLYTRNENNETVIYLQTGKVLFYSINPNGSIKEQMILTPGQKGVYNRTTGVMHRETFSNDNFLAWQSGKLVFIKAPLANVFKVLEKTYHVQIIADKTCNNYYLTATYQDESPKDILRTLHIIYGFNCKLSGDIIYISQPSE